MDVIGFFGLPAAIHDDGLVHVSRTYGRVSAYVGLDLLDSGFFA